MWKICGSFFHSISRSLLLIHSLSHHIWHLIENFSLLFPSVNKFTKTYITYTPKKQRDDELDFRKQWNIFHSNCYEWMNEWMNEYVNAAFSCSACFYAKFAKYSLPKTWNTIRMDNFRVFLSLCVSIFNLLDLICVHCVCARVWKYFYKLFVLMTSCCPSLLTPSISFHFISLSMALSY